MDTDTHTHTHTHTHAHTDARDSLERRTNERTAHGLFPVAIFAPLCCRPIRPVTRQLHHDGGGGDRERCLASASRQRCSGLEKKGNTKTGVFSISIFPLPSSPEGFNSGIPRPCTDPTRAADAERSSKRVPETGDRSPLARSRRSPSWAGGQTPSISSPQPEPSG